MRPAMDKDVHVGVAAGNNDADSFTSIPTAWYNEAVNRWHRPRQGEERTWFASWLYFGPLSGLFTMTMASASLVASFGILIGSDGEKTENWPTPPSTYLAIFTAIANISMRYAACQGVVVAWWYSALKGSTISRLHLDWRSGTSVIGAIANGRRMGVAGFACLLATIVAIDGPLLQRSSTVVVAQKLLTLNISMAPEVPHGYTGSWLTLDSAALGSFAVNPVFNSTIPTINGTQRNIYTGNQAADTANATYGFSTGAPIADAVQGCPGVCNARIQAPGLFPIACRTQSIDVDGRMHFNFSATMQGQHSAPLEVEAFFITIDILLESHEAINLITGFTTYNDNCTGELSYTVCTLEPGIGEYDVLIDNDRIVMNSLATPTLIALANNTAISYNNSTNPSDGHLSTLGGLQSFMQLTFQSYLVNYFRDSGWDSLIIGPSLEISQFIEPGGSVNCPSHRNPQEFIINKLNKLMVYYGAAAAKKDKTYLETNMDPGLSSETTVTAYPSSYWNVYQTNYWWFFGAAFIEVACILLILPTYWGFWRLGRPVSFSPLEIAKAFESPLLAECNSNATGGDIAFNCRNKAVKYGRVEVEKTSKVAFGDRDVVNPLMNWSRFDL